MEAELPLLLIFLSVWVLSLWLGSVALESTGMERHKARFQALQHVGDHVIARIIAGEKASASDSTLKSAGFWGQGLTILAVERGNTVIQLPDADITVKPDDRVLCYGNLATINALQP